MTHEDNYTDDLTLTWMHGSRVNKIMLNPMCVYAVILDIKLDICVA